MERLGRQPGVRVYVDAGNAGSRTPDALFRPLRRAGIGAADGFPVNVSNFETRQASTEFGSGSRRRSAPSRSSSTPAATATAPTGAAPPGRTGATRPAGRWARRRPTRVTNWSTPTSGLSGPASPTATAGAARRRAPGGPSTRWAWHGRRSSRSGCGGAPATEHPAPAPAPRPLGTPPPIAERTPPRSPAVPHPAALREPGRPRGWSASGAGAPRSSGRRRCASRPPGRTRRPPGCPGSPSCRGRVSMPWTLRLSEPVRPAIR